MALITWQGRALECAAGETVLDCLVRSGVPAASSCRTGACQTCVLRAARGTPPAASQRGLKDTWKAQGLFLACQCVPEEDLEVAPADALPSVRVTARRIEHPAPDVARVFLEPAAPFAYRAGQFVHLGRDDGLTRSYSLASVPGQDELLELHVKRLPGGAMSGYLCDALRPGDALTVRGPAGDCFYVEGRPDQPLVLAGTGTGLAPLLGVARDAVMRGHRGPICLMHGARTRAGLYADAEARALAARHDALEYTPCVLSDEGAGEPVTVGRLDALVVRAARDQKDCRIFLCGSPELVRKMRMAVFLAGASMANIHADAFVTAAPPTGG